MRLLERGVDEEREREANELIGMVDAYTLKAVGQEDFSDVKVPEAPVQKPEQKK